MKSAQDSAEGLWTRYQPVRPKPQPSVEPRKPVVQSVSLIDDVPFEIDPTSMSSILSDSMPVQDSKLARYTLAGGTAPMQSPAKTGTSIDPARRSSLYGGALRVKAPVVDHSKKNPLRTPGRVIAKSRIPGSSNSTTPKRSSRTSYKADSASTAHKFNSRTIEMLGKDFSQCPDFLMSANLQKTANQTQSASLSQPNLSTNIAANLISFEQQNQTSNDLTKSLEIAKPTSTVQSTTQNIENFSNPPQIKKSNTTIGISTTEKRVLPKPQITRDTIGFQFKGQVSSFSVDQLPSKDLPQSVVHKSDLTTISKEVPSQKPQTTKLDSLSLPFPPTPKRTTEKLASLSPKGILVPSSNIKEKVPEDFKDLLIPLEPVVVAPSFEPVSLLEPALEPVKVPTAELESIQISPTIEASNIDKPSAKKEEEQLLVEKLKKLLEEKKLLRETFMKQMELIEEQEATLIKMLLK